ncbi:MAG: GerAB/ArcD/ProY family transporter [Bacillota bacterium]|nr:GerAB/ArcD/ProY family transporter [Bacillota bacterium]
MLNKGKISVSQLFVMLFICRVVVLINFGTYLTSVNYVGDTVISAVISYFLTFLLALPIYFLYKRNSNFDIYDFFNSSFGKYSAFLILIYVVYYLYICSYSLSLYDLFVTDVLNPKTSILALSIAVLVTSAYGAWKGLEALARTSGIILFLICLGFIFLFCTLTPQVDKLNFRPMFYDGYNNLNNGTVYMISRFSYISIIAMLLPYFKGKVKKGFFIWNTTSTLLIMAVIILLTGILGDYISTQPFPVYTLTSMASLGVLQRLDGLYLGMWTAGMFIKLSVYIFVSALCVEKIFSKNAGKIAILINSAIVLVVCNLAIAHKELIRIIFNQNIMLAFVILTAFLLPLFALLGDIIKKKVMQ